MHAVCDTDVALDLSGLHCPWTVLRCKAALQRLNPEDELTITTDNMDATRDIHLFIQRGVVKFLGVRCDEHGCHFKVRAAHPGDHPARLQSPSKRLRITGRVLERWLAGHWGIPAVD